MSPAKLALPRWRHGRVFCCSKSFWTRCAQHLPCLCLLPELQSKRWCRELGEEEATVWYVWLMLLKLLAVFCQRARQHWTIRIQPGWALRPAGLRTSSIAKVLEAIPWGATTATNSESGSGSEAGEEASGSRCGELSNLTLALRSESFFHLFIYFFSGQNCCAVVCTVA